MALTIATGFVVDDAIVVIETHAISGGGHGAAGSGDQRRGGNRVTVLSMSLSLIAVFLPILMMGGIVGRLFREFAITLSVAISGFARDLADHHADDVCPHASRP